MVKCVTLKTKSSDAHIKEIEDWALFTEKKAKFKSDLKASERYVLLTEAFSDLSMFLFTHNNRLYDFDSPINEVHFAVRISHEGVQAEIKCYADNVTVLIRGETENFVTVNDAINYVKNFRQ